MKRFFNIALLSSLLASCALADEDLLAKLTNGALSDNSKGVKVLNLDEMKEVKGGYQFVRNSNYDYPAGTLTSYGYEVRDDLQKSTSVVSTSLGYSSSVIIVAKYRYVNNQKDYYLQYYTNGSRVGTNIWAYRGSPAYDILNEFQRKY